MSSELPGHIVSTTFCAIASILIAYQVFKHPNKLRIFILVYSILTLPASVIATLQIEGYVSYRTNSMVYLISTLLMTVIHFFMLLDVGYRLRRGDGDWKHYLVVVGIVFLTITCILLFVQIIIMAVNHDGEQHFPLQGAFIAGVVAALIGDSSVFTYTFMPLIYWKKNRVNDGYSRTTALGIWFYLIQNIWYFLYGVIYIWFFVMNTWDAFPTLLALDYALRFIENLLYTWPPPKWAIDYLSAKLPNTSVQLSTRKTGESSTANHAMSSERYNKEDDVEYGNSPSKYPTVPDQHSTFGSEVTIIK
ncbi:hypothetical protein INT48_008306 [Thamnidium elegans]|uniref:Uncharacterized protein n=1 Tax=Thamnidium elegans TaxID=101142 RepID=A0A8H7VR27_9FUNG|nr:hypothetical protein INT48_008306 [Thamnidium elegans]